MKALTIRPGKLTLAQLRDVYQHPVTLTLDDNAYGPIQQSVACVERIVEETAPLTASTPGLACWLRPASPATIWKTCSVQSCCHTPPAWASPPTTIWCA